MRLLIAFAALALPLSSASAERTRSLPVQIGDVPMRPCENPRVQHAGGKAKGEARSLGELPPGNVVLTVMRGTGNCYRPVIVRRGVGAAGEQAGTPVPLPVERPQKPRMVR